MQRYDEGINAHPLVGLGLKTGSDAENSDIEISIADLKRVVEPLTEDIRDLNEGLRDLKKDNQRLRDDLLKVRQECTKLKDQNETQAIINQELARRLIAFEEGGLERVPVSSTNITDVIEYRGYDSNIINALMYLERKQIIYVKDLKRLGIKLNQNLQYIRFLKKIGSISGNPAEKNRNGFWYVAKKDEQL